MRIGFTGTMSVGKSTLVKELAKLSQFENYYFATERSKYLRDLGIPLNTDSTLIGQMIFQAERASELIYENLLTDRTIIDVIAFTNLSKTIPRNQKQPLIDSMSLLVPKYDYIFYIDPKGTIIEDNGVREIDSEYRDMIDDDIRYQLKENKVQYYTISGSTEDRIKSILEIIE